jgi:1-pyrroline-5-carboxylate dehydrogenase
MYFWVSLSVQGKWIGSSNWNTVVDPLNGEPFIKVAEVDEAGVQVLFLKYIPFVVPRNLVKTPT